MNRKKIIIAISVILGALILGAAFFWFNTDHQRQGQENLNNVQSDEITDGMNETQESNQIDSNSNDDQASGSDQENIPNGILENGGSSLPGQNEDQKNGTNFLTINDDNCENGCTGFQEDELEYCQKICGLAEDSTVENESVCQNLNDLKKDYCYKDLAITKSNLRFCENISDNNIKKSCNNRSSEDIIDQSLGNISE